MLCDVFFLFCFFLDSGDQKERHESPLAGFYCHGAVPNVQNTSCPCGYVAAASVKIKR